MQKGTTKLAIVSGPILRERGPETKSLDVLLAERLAEVAIAILLLGCANVANLFVARQRVGMRLRFDLHWAAPGRASRGKCA